MKLALGAADHDGMELEAVEDVSRWVDDAPEQGGADLDSSAVVATILGQPPRP